MRLRWNDGLLWYLSGLPSHNLVRRTVTFEGRQYTKTKGLATGHISANDFRKLVSEFEKIDYFSLPIVTSGTKECREWITICPLRILRFDLKEDQRALSIIMAAGNAGALAKLTS